MCPLSYFFASLSISVNKRVVSSWFKFFRICWPVPAPNPPESAFKSVASEEGSRTGKRTRDAHWASFIDTMFLSILSGCIKTGPGGSEGML